MAKSKTATSAPQTDTNSQSAASPVVTTTLPRASAIAARGVGTASELAGFLLGVAFDAVDKHLTPAEANAASKAVAGATKLIELNIKYGKSTGHGKVLQLNSVPPENAAEDSEGATLTLNLDAQLAVLRSIMDNQQAASADRREAAIQYAELIGRAA